jgi:hypothetical protein
MPSNLGVLDVDKVYSELFAEVSMEEAENLVLKLVQAHTPPGKCVLAGNSVSQVFKGRVARYKGVLPGS